MADPLKLPVINLVFNSIHQQLSLSDGPVFVGSRDSRTCISSGRVQGAGGAICGSWVGQMNYKELGSNEKNSVLFDARYV